MDETGCKCLKNLMKLINWHLRSIITFSYLKKICQGERVVKLAQSRSNWWSCMKWYIIQRILEITFTDDYSQNFLQVLLDSTQIET